MEFEDLEPKNKIVKPKDLSGWGVGELKDYIARLQAEIARAQRPPSPPRTSTAPRPPRFSRPERAQAPGIAAKSRGGRPDSGLARHLALELGDPIYGREAT